MGTFYYYFVFLLIFDVQRRGTRMAVGDVRKQLNEIMNVQLQQEEVTESLRQMDADGIVQLNERAQTIFVKSVLI